MSKKGVVIASAVAAAILIGGCASQDQPMPQDSSNYQSGHSAKMGKMGGSSCKGNHCSSNGCKGK